MNSHEPPAPVTPVPDTLKPRQEHEVVHSTNGHANCEAVVPVAAPKREEAPIEQRLLTIVRERTGYPEEMLGLDLDMEADLGIDSIKRVEILGTLRDSLPTDMNGSESELMDQLARHERSARSSNA